MLYMFEIAFPILEIEILENNEKILKNTIGYKIHNKTYTLIIA